MARIETDPNYTAPTFSRATAATDPFKKEDVQNLAAAMSTHDHSTGKGVAVPFSTAIPNGTITSAMIADATIDTADLKDGAVTSAKIADGTIATADLANASVTNAKLASDTARANLLVNGGFEVWQRGTSGFIANGAYSADKWTNSLGGASTFSTLGKDTTNQDAGSTADLGFTYSHAVESFIYQKYEDGIQLRGRTITLSIRVKSSVANAVRPFLQQNPGASNTYGTYHTGSGNYETLTVSVTVSGSTNNVLAGVSLMASGVGYLDNAMLVVGSVPADYAPLHPADDLARCLRYYEIIGESGTGEVIVQGYQAAGANVYNTVVLKARKAVAPTVTKVGTWTLINTSGGPTIDVQALDCFRAYVTATAAGYAYATNSGAGQRLVAEANP